METAKKVRNDILLAAAVLIVAAAAFFCFLLLQKDGSYVQVVINGDLVETLDLSEDTVKVIKTEHGVNTLVIKNGEAYMESADCSDKICVSHRAIKSAGETIVCLPHKLVIEID